MIVQGREDFLIFAQGEATIEEPQSHRGAVSQGNLSRIDRQIICRGPQYCRLLLFFVLGPITDGVSIQPAPVPFDRRSDRSGMGREKNPARWMKSRES